MSGQGLYPGRTREARVPRWLLWTLVVTSVLGVTGLAFLGGYLVAVRRAATAEGGMTPSPPEAETPAADGAGARAERAPGVAPRTTTASPVVTPVEPGGAGQGSSVLAAQVAAYFAETDALMSAAKANGDPETVARQILTQVAGGDTTGLDDLMAKQRDLAARLGAVRAPAPCAEHLRRSLELIERSTRFLGVARDAITKGNIEGLGELQTLGVELQSEARGIDTLGQQIRRQYLGEASG